MVQKVGLLPASNVQQIPFAYTMFARGMYAMFVPNLNLCCLTEDMDGLRNSEGFKKTFSIDVKIDFVGVWCEFNLVAKLWRQLTLPFDRETVASVGITNKELPFVANNTAIR